MQKKSTNTTKKCKVCNKKIKVGTLCSTCQRKKNPVKYAYQTLKDNAKRRKKEFDISLEDFQEFCIKTRYIAKKGIYKDSLHIDRVSEQGGYTKQNIQVLTNSQNVKKYLKYYWDEYNRKMIFKFKTIKYEKEGECITASNEHYGTPF